MPKDNIVQINFRHFIKKWGTQGPLILLGIASERIAEQGDAEPFGSLSKALEDLGQDLRGLLESEQTITERLDHERENQG